MFGILTKEPLPKAYLTSYEAWDEYMALVWYKILFSHGIATTEAIIEVAPGSSVKIGKALARLSFAGELYLIEPYDRAQGSIVDQYRAILPAARIYLIEDTFANSLQYLPRRIGCILSNHPLDDMILAHGLDKKEYPVLFGWRDSPSHAHTTMFKRRWDALKSSPDKLEAIPQVIANEWLDAAKTLRPAHIIISQYASSALTAGGMEDLNEMAKSVLYNLKHAWGQCVLPDKDIQQCLDVHKNFGNRYIGTEVLNAAHWLATNA